MVKVCVLMDSRISRIGLSSAGTFHLCMLYVYSGDRYNLCRPIILHGRHSCELLYIGSFYFDINHLDSSD